KAALDDAPELIAFVEAVAGESDNLTFGPGEFGLSLAQEEEYLKNLSGSENQIYLVGLVEGEIVASITFVGGKRTRTRHTGEFGISVRKAFWDLGVGGAMIEALLDWARAAGFIQKISLRVRTDNERAIALYKKKGFEIEGILRGEFKIDGRLYDLYAMSRFI
ncbi:MAG TPA: GNAT family N-acetyltransferase, partial [Rectinemataceae bacterium]